MPPLMNNHGNYIVSMGNVCRWMAEQAEALGVEIFPGMAASAPVWGEKGQLKGVVAGEFGLNADGTPGDGYEPGMELHGKYVLLAEGVRGSLSKQAIAKFALDSRSDVQKYGIGMKELWEVKPENHKPGQVTHTMGWPLGGNAGGGSFMYHLENNQVYVGFVVHLNYANPHLYPYMEFQRFKHHPEIAKVLEGGKRIAYGARAITEGGWQSLPKLVFPGGALLGCSAGMVNVPRIKGNHNAMLSGKAAAEAAWEALQAGRAQDELTAYEAEVRSGPIAKDLKRVRNVKPLWSRYGMLASLGLGGLDMWARRQARRHRLPETGRGAELRPADQRGLLLHQPRGKPARASEADRPGYSGRQEPAALRRAGPALLPRRGLRGHPRRRRVEPAVPDQLPELRPLQDLRHQGPGPEHHLDHAAGGRRAELSEHVRGGPHRSQPVGTGACPALAVQGRSGQAERNRGRPRGSPEWPVSGATRARDVYCAFSSVEMSSRIWSEVSGAPKPTPNSLRISVPVARTPSHSPP
jgi:flavin-dependent dehydrogenase